MKVSLNWIRFINDKYGCAADPAPDGINALVEKIGAQLGAVDEVIDVGKKYVGIVIVKVISSQKHPNAEKLTVCLVDDGGAVKKVKRDKNGLIEIVCGAPNVKAGMLAAWIPPGVTVPATFDKDPFVVDSREIRGVVSHGMLASPKELALGDEHDVILEVDEPAKPGTALAEVYGLDDYIIDIENKMFTHRPDCFGILGVAREIAGIQGHVFKSPDWYKMDAPIPISRARDDHKLVVKNQVPKLVARFCALVMKNVSVRPSPIWLKVRLASAGIRPINNLVDLTNFYMLETAQPIHAYDYDKLLAQQQQVTSNKQQEARMGIRLSKEGEELRLLGGKTLKLEAGAILITAGTRPIGLGGVMGGAETEVDASTKSIILECANFDMNTTRSTAMHYGLFTDAATRFTKNQSPLQNRAVIAKIAADITRLAGGRVSGPLIDDNHLSPQVLKRGNIHRPVTLTPDFINARLGLDLSAKTIQKLLTNVEFKVSASSERLIVAAPFWRTDIESPEDIVEEVGRLYGYDHLPLVLPQKDLTPALVNPALEFKSRLRDVLSAAGTNEVLTYSFVHGSLLQAAGQDEKAAYHVRNALSPDLQYYRLSLTPSLLEKVHPNIKAGHDQFVLYEIGKAHVKGVNDKEKLPAELERLAIVIAAKENSIGLPTGQAGAPFYAAKKYVEHLLHEIGIHSPEYKPISEKQLASWQTAAKAYEPKRSAEIRYQGQLIGIVGEPTLKLKKSLKLPIFCAQAELDLGPLLEAASTTRYIPLNRFPKTEQDFCLKTSVEISYLNLTDFLRRSFDELSKQHGYAFWLKPLDIYQRKNDPKHKQTTWHVILSHPERTLTTAETNTVLDKIAKAAKAKFKAERV